MKIHDRNSKYNLYFKCIKCKNIYNIPGFCYCVTLIGLDHGSDET